MAGRDIVVIRHLRICTMKTENLKKMVASLNFESGDLPCPLGALSLNGATSLSSGTCKVFIFCIYCHAVHCARHFYYTVAT